MVLVVHAHALLELCHPLLVFFFAHVVGLGANRFALAGIFVEENLRDTLAQYCIAKVTIGQCFLPCKAMGVSFHQRQPGQDSR